MVFVLSTWFVRLFVVLKSPPCYPLKHRLLSVREEGHFGPRLCHNQRRKICLQDPRCLRPGILRYGIMVMTIN